MSLQRSFYLDVNVFSGLSEDTTHLHRTEGERLFKYTKDNSIKVIVSSIVYIELNNAPKHVQDKIV